MTKEQLLEQADAVMTTGLASLEFGDDWSPAFKGKIMTIDWKKNEITKAEAVEILKHAHECVDYVSKTLPMKPSPGWIFASILTQIVDLLGSLVHWLTPFCFSPTESAGSRTTSLPGRLRIWFHNAGGSIGHTDTEPLTYTAAENYSGRVGSTEPLPPMALRERAKEITTEGFWLDDKAFVPPQAIVRIEILTK